MIYRYEVDASSDVMSFLKAQGYSRKLFKAIKLEAGYIHLNNQLCKMNQLVNIGDIIEVKLPTETIGRQLVEETSQLTIIYEDAHLLIVDKPENMPCIPNNCHRTGSLAQAIITHYNQTNHHATVHLVTRLDKDTSGLVVVAKNRLIHHLLTVDLKQKIKRYYIAKVEGTMSPKEGMIDKPILTIAGDMRRIIDEQGKPACTLYQVHSYDQDTSRVICQLLTGRTHQIRVHMSALGHPIVGDMLYGSTILLPRHLLHSYRLEIEHPITKVWLTFTSHEPF